MPPPQTPSLPLCQCLQNGAVQEEEERFDLRQWRLLPRMDKPDRFSLTLGISNDDDDEASSDSNVVTFKVTADSTTVLGGGRGMYVGVCVVRMGWRQATQGTLLPCMCV
jgi:hypothetical protein